MGSIRAAAPFAVASLMLMSCAAAPSLADMDPGPRPADSQALVKAYFQRKLMDPESAEYKFDEPHQAFVRYAPIRGGGVKYAAWFVDFDMNAKNAMGGYVGWQHYTFAIRYGAITERYGVPIDWGD